ncbi:kinase-like protein [Sodiomyces alkalinus F11]|uniref:non-specific serine/threonine protein kinase n=1 Tax=Sodiomyces alkalinus (strain CBS 110278 / VKM F-3762 / F11) TaxID=1314773 RepID=A0A3N2PS24_SODAK|nr:kinase-like protein [Sodiomyces alkalinus F11]ROT37305.1 kinase-like protein [Sodiomyces alkalinus F11]
MAQVLLDLLYSFGNCLNCFPGSPTLKINGRNFKILRLLGEGGFSYVYLVQDTSTESLYALKKIRCPFGAESVAQAMREVEAYRLFANTPGIIHAVDHAVATDRGGEPDSKTVYVLLPYFKRGNLQDMINANAVNHAQFPERRLMLLFLGVCRALKSMHQYRARPVAIERMEMGHGDEDDQGHGPRPTTAARGGQRVTSARAAVPDDQDEGEQQRPLIESSEGAPAGEQRSYAHRDIKPGNIIISDDGAEPILMDLGSVAASPLPITSHSLAIQTQDTAAEHSTMPYRAPELFDVQTGTVIDTKVDIWSLGCTLYACLVGKSPFEARSDETGGTLSLCILGGDWRFPDEGLQRTGTGALNKGKARAVDGAGAGAGAGAGGGGAANGSAGRPPISEPVRDVVRRCLRVEPAERPDIDELIDIVERVIDELPEDDA